MVQRGNRRQVVFFNDEDRYVYLSWYRFYLKKYAVSSLAHCLMDNHVHLVLVPSDKDGLSQMLKVLNGNYAHRINQRHQWSGHLWQQRFFSCPLDRGFLREAVRYVECNPVRARMVKHAHDYKWSSTQARMYEWKNVAIDYSNSWNAELPKAEGWRAFLERPNDQAIELIRRNLTRNLPLGSDEFIENLEKQAARSLKFKNRGRPRSR